MFPPFTRLRDPELLLMRNSRKQGASISQTEIFDQAAGPKAGRNPCPGRNGPYALYILQHPYSPLNENCATPPPRPPAAPPPAPPSPKSRHPDSAARHRSIETARRPPPAYSGHTYLA